MKSYKDFEQKPIGDSDVAMLVLVGCRAKDGIVTEPLRFGEDGSYKAYLVNGKAKIGGHYKKVATFHNWLKIYDDEKLTLKVEANEINIYRAGIFGCIIQIMD